MAQTSRIFSKSVIRWNCQNTFCKRQWKNLWISDIHSSLRNLVSYAITDISSARQVHSNQPISISNWCDEVGICPVVHLNHVTDKCPYIQGIIYIHPQSCGEVDLDRWSSLCTSSFIDLVHIHLVSRLRSWSLILCISDWISVRDGASWDYWKGCCDNTCVCATRVRLPRGMWCRERRPRNPL